MRMSEAKYGKTMMSSIVPVFRFASYGLLSCKKRRTFERTNYHHLAT
ncbi:hypothetical protein OHM78_01915 [Coxiella burnetii]|nr:hypothetical protein [Coxiella burnetii]UYK70647.1 hypothetical protein OHM78_01915 [Coxiella burnetii]